MPVEHEGPLRVSGIQSGVFSGAVGITVGQQPFRDGLRVREVQPTQWGWTPRYGVLEVRARMELTARSMASVWMVGIEDEPQRSGEICVFEVFGDAIDRAGPAVGMGIHPFRDPALRDDFAALRLPVDVTGFHVYAADWRPGCVDFFVDGDHVRTVEQAPDYPMQMMIGVFDFPTRPSPNRAGYAVCRCSSSTTCTRPEPARVRASMPGGGRGDRSRSTVNSKF